MEKDILLVLKRNDLQSLRTLGELSITGVKSAVTIEDTVRKEKIHGKTAVPYGTYLLKTRFSPKFSKYFFWSDKHNKLIDAVSYFKLDNKEDYKIHDLIWLSDIPNYEFVLVHWGNTENDTDGCIIVGTSVSNDKKQILASKLKYMQIYPIIYEQVKLGNKYIEIK